MDSVDRALIDEHEALVANPRKRAKRAAILKGSTYTRPLRSWSLVLRANDKRLEARCPARAVEYLDWDGEQPLCAVLEFALSAEVVRELCGPVVIPWPGISIDKAAELFGVNRTTIHRWAGAKLAQVGKHTWRKERRLVLDLYCKRGGTDLHRAEKLVWTRTALDAAGEVWCGPWGSLAKDLTHRVLDEWTQCVTRTHRLLSPGTFVRMLKCPSCGRWCYKLYWPQGVWTIAAWMGGGMASAAEAAEPEAAEPGVARPEAAEAEAAEAGRFVCRRCARLLYESAERSSRPGPGRVVDAMDRFVKRAVGAPGMDASA